MVWLLIKIQIVCNQPQKTPERDRSAIWKSVIAASIDFQTLQHIFQANLNGMAQLGHKSKPPCVRPFNRKLQIFIKIINNP